MGIRWEIIYNKLVRGNIVKFIQKDGKACKTKNISDNKYTKMSDVRLDEKLAE